MHSAPWSHALVVSIVSTDTANDNGPIVRLTNGGKCEDHGCVSNHYANHRKSSEALDRALDQIDDVAKDAERVQDPLWIPVKTLGRAITITRMSMDKHDKMYARALAKLDSEAPMDSGDLERMLEYARVRAELEALVAAWGRETEQTSIAERKEEQSNFQKLWDSTLNELKSVLERAGISTAHLPNPYRPNQPTKKKKPKRRPNR